jgi:hypothetical protein
MEEKTYVKLYRTDEAIELLKFPKTFALFTLIALRARRTDTLNIQGLNVGEAFLGDHEVVGLTRQEYRTRLKKLRKLKLITYRTTNKGTIATIINKDIYDINEDHKKSKINRQVTTGQPSSNHQLTGNKNVDNDIMINDNKYGKFKKNNSKRTDKSQIESRPTYKDHF